MLLKYVTPGDRVELTALHRGKEISSKDERKKIYRTKIYDIVSDEEMKVFMPMEHGKLVLLPIDSEYDVCFYTKKGLYQCYATISDRYKSNNVFVLTMEVTSNLRKFQRREYYRLNCILDMKCTSIEDDDLEKINQEVEFLENEFTLQDGVIVDISGGGVRFISKEKFEKGTRILFVFNLKLEEEVVPYHVVGKILLSVPIEGREDEFENRVQFLDMDNEDREGIIKFIFEEERKIRRRENN